MTGGAGRDRTGDLLNANQALSQLSYSPFFFLACAGLLSHTDAGIENVFEADWTLPAGTWPTSKEIRKTLSGESGTDSSVRLIRRSGIRWIGKTATYFETACLRARLGFR